MPNGYTVGIYDGTMSSGKEFLLKYVKTYGLGYFITEQGELDMPKEYSEDIYKEEHYYKDRLDETIKALEEFNSLSEVELKKKYHDEIDEINEANKSSNKRISEMSKRYDDMIEKISVWQAPDELLDMKKNAIEMLIHNKEFDCVSYQRELFSYDDWLDSIKNGLERDVKYYEEGFEKEQKRNKEMKELLKKFYKSIENLD